MVDKPHQLSKCADSWEGPGLTSSLQYRCSTAVLRRQSSLPSPQLSNLRSFHSKYAIALLSCHREQARLPEHQPVGNDSNTIQTPFLPFDTSSLANIYAAEEVETSPRNPNEYAPLSKDETCSGNSRGQEVHISHALQRKIRTGHPWSDACTRGRELRRGCRCHSAGLAWDSSSSPVVFASRQATRERRHAWLGPLQ